MTRSRSIKKSGEAKGASPLMVRLDKESKQYLAEAADLRRISVSDYVRTVAVPQAKREVRAAAEKVISLTGEEQLLFWNALNEAPRITAAQRLLGSAMRGET